MPTRSCSVALILLACLLGCIARPYRAPVHGNLNDTSRKVVTKLEHFDELAVPIRRRNLVIYHVGAVNDYESGWDVATNNVLLFTSAMQSHHDGSPQEAFYLFNVVGGKENPLRPHIPTKQSNVGVIDWLHANDDKELHMLTVKLLSSTLINKFGAVFFLNQDVRGPLTNRKSGQWIQEFRKLLDSNNVGIVGPTINCENSPHVSNFMFAVQPKLLDMLLQGNEGQLGNSDFVKSAGYNISSLLYSRKYRVPYFNGKCPLLVESTILSASNPVTWCHILPKEVIFMYWGGEAVRSLGYMCKHTLAMMRDTLAAFKAAYPKLGLAVPETLTGGRLYEMYKEYGEEMYMDHVRPRAAPGLNTALLTAPGAHEKGPAPTTDEVNTVCLVVGRAVLCVERVWICYLFGPFAFRLLRSGLNPPCSVHE
jgi:hypothetical protein